MTTLPLIQDCVLIAVGTIGFDITGEVVLAGNLTDAATAINVNAGAIAYVLADEGNTYSGTGSVEPLASDRAAWNALNYPARHTNDIDDSPAAIHHTIGVNADQAAAGDHTHPAAAGVDIASDSANIAAVNFLEDGKPAAPAANHRIIYAKSTGIYAEDSAGNEVGPLGAGGVTSITAGTGLTSTPNPITATGTIALNATLNDLTDVNTTGEATGDVIYDNAGTWIPYPLGVGSKITVSGTKIRFGNVGGGNYLEIDSVTGTLRLAGDATTWDDFRVEASIVKPGATAPSYKAFGPSGNLQALMFEAGHHDEAMFEMQLPHNWKLGSNIYPHVHWAPTTADAGNVVWELEYSWCNIGGTFGAPSNMASDATAAGGTAWVHKLTYLKSGGNNYIDGTGKTLSSMLVCRIHRNSNSGSDTLNKDVALLEVDFHYQIDSIGSDEELVKDASASLLLETGDILLLESGDRLLLE